MSYTDMRVVEFEAADGKTYQAKLEKSNDIADMKKKHGRAFVWGVEDPNFDMVKQAAKNAGFDNPYTRRGEYPEVDEAWDTFNAALVMAERQILLAAISELDINEQIQAVAFSRTAGCSCGCSPGFIVKGIDGNKTIHVEILKKK